MTIRIILIRHGQTEWNRKKKYCGWVDITLNKKGMAQGRKLSKILTKEKIDKTYSSDMKRTVQFAKISLKDRPIQKLRQIREINFGVFEGLNYAQAMKKYPCIYRKWLNNPLNFKIPGGESLNILAKRVRRAWKKIISQKNYKTIAVFSHAGPIKIILCDLLKLDLKKEFWRLNPAPASINIIKFNGKNYIYSGRCKKR
jgi:broad specificity phosphatase PhoE